MSHFSRRGYKKSNKLRSPKIFTKHNCLNSKQIYSDYPEFLQIACIDPGTSSCGIKIKRLYMDSGSTRLIWLSVINFGKDSSDINTNMDSTMNIIKNALMDCHYIVTEHQLLKSELVYQGYSALLFYLTNHICPYRMKPILMEVDCQLKTSYIGGPKNKTQNNGVPIKEWSKTEARKRGVYYGDNVSYHILENSLSKQNEDLSDASCYYYAFLKYLKENNFFCPVDKNKIIY